MDKQGEEYFQITLGGAWGIEAAIGKVIGPAVVAEEVPQVIERLVANFEEYRRPHERFIDTVRRIGSDSFRDAAYGTNPAPENVKEVSHG